MFPFRYVVALSAALLLCGCSARLHNAPPVSGFPSLADLSRVASANSDEFIIRQAGSDFAKDLPSHGCTSNVTVADFAPSWSNNPPKLDNASYCIYRLTYDPINAPIKLTLSWGTPPAANTDCWLAISNWVRGSWSMQVLPVGSELTLDNPADYVDANGHCYVAVILLGDTPCSLSTIGYGDPPAPPTGDGYTLVAPLSDTKTYLIDMDGNVVHDWTANLQAGAEAELMENGHLLRAGNMGNNTFSAGGRGGRLTEFDWDGNVVWHYDLSTSTQCTHHAFRRLPNGNILLIAWNLIADADIIEDGRNPARVKPGQFWADSIIEIEPTQPNGGNIVWQWNVMDHLVQDFDITKLNFADPAQHPELLDLNYPPGEAGDWTHVNCVDYNAALDQIMVTCPTFGEIWVIDHSTTMAEAAGHSGGQQGHGGDILYRWGNPQAYRAGGVADQKLFFCHNGHWLEDGLVGAGDIMVFNNNAGTLTGEDYSSVVQFTPPLNGTGGYDRPGPAFGPDTLMWEYTATPRDSFWSTNMSSAQRLPGGNTLVCTGGTGLLFEVDLAGNTVWSWQNVYPATNSKSVFRVIRYTPDYPGLGYL